MSSVTWILNGGSYEVSSKEHLLMIMQLGTFTGDDTITYTASGSVPPSYITSDFRQTADIDLEIDSNCHPIGRLTGTSFTGEYDGAGFSISNFTSTPASSAVHGLFGWLGGATLKDITLTGNWNVTGSSNTADVSGVLVSRLNGTGNIIERIDINGVATCTGTTDSFGCIVSKIQGDVDITDILVRGSVNGTAVDYCGGVVGHIDSGTVTAKNIRYAPTGDLEYTRSGGSGLNGTNAVGGIIGTIDAAAIVTIENLVNAMAGNLTGVNTGGVIGMSLITNAANMICTNLVNGMTGSLLASGAGGGIFGRSTVGTCSYLLNVMRGDISTSSRAGGIAGLFVDGTATNCIVAMNGDISGSALSNSDVGSSTIQAGSLTIEWATGDFGLSVFGTNVTTDVLTKPVASTPWAYHADFPEIPYLEMSATDSESNVTYVSTPFPNISGNGTIYDLEYDYYTVGFDRSFFPVETVLGVAISDYSLFKYDTVGLNAIESQGSGVSFVETPYSSLYIQLFSHIAVVNWYGTSSSYTVSSTETGMSELTQSETSGFTAQLTVSPGIEYVFKVYGDGVIIGTSTALTSPVSSGSSVTDIVTYLGNDLSSLEESSLTGVLEHIGVALDTLDEVEAVVYVGSSFSTKKLTFVDDADTINISNLSNVLTPFVDSNGSSQSITLQLSDTSTELMSYNEVSDEITVNAQTYAVGDYFILDGKKVMVAALE